MAIPQKFLEKAEAESFHVVKDAPRAQLGFWVPAGPPMGIRSPEEAIKHAMKILENQRHPNKISPKPGG